MQQKKKSNTPVRTSKFVSVAAKDTPFAYTEAYKTLRTNLSFLTNVSGVRSVLITSAVPEESKSTTAINLAITLASSGKSVVLVVRSKFASARTVRQAKNRLESVGIRILGGVLTRFNMCKSGWRGGYDYKTYEYGYGSSKGKR